MHQPTLGEIALIGETDFFTGCGVLTFDKNQLEQQDKINSQNATDFDIILMMLSNKDIQFKKNRVNAMMVLSLLFPEYSIQITESGIVLLKEGDTEVHSISNMNYHVFKNIITEMLCLSGKTAKGYNPGGELAKKIADKLKERHKKLAQEHKGKKIEILDQYVSILSVGVSKDKNTLTNYTVYQLFDEYMRFRAKMDYDMFISLKLAGAKDVKDVKSWLADIHSDDNDS